MSVNTWLIVALAVLVVLYLMKRRGRQRSGD
jgi:hypothetical protein